MSNNDTSRSTEDSAGIDPFDWPRAAGKVAGVRYGIDGVVRRRRWRRIQSGGALLGLIVVVGLFFRSAGTAENAASPLASLPVRELLPDGSVVDLKDGARISVLYSEAERRVILEDGEAHFEVARILGRPFTVEVAGVAVRAVGTAFLVQRHAESIEVVVTHGAVSIDRNRMHKPDPAAAMRPAPPLAILEVGKRAVVPLGYEANLVPTPTVVPVTTTELESRLAWRIPRVEFRATPLSDVLPLFNRYGAKRIRLANLELESLEISGVLRADNIPALLAILESSYGVTAQEHGENVIVLLRSR